MNNHTKRLLLIGLLPLAPGIVMSFFSWLSPLLSLVFGLVFMFVWYHTGLSAVNDRKNILSSAVLLNMPATVFLVSSLIHQFVLHSYSGIIGLLTQSFFMPTVFISSEILGLISGKTMPAGVCSTGGLETDIISFILLIGSFIVGAIVGKIRRNRPSV